MIKKYLLILTITLAAFFLTVYSTHKPDTRSQASTNELLLRKIGHQLLHSSGDDSSRVMPINIISPNEFRISFENHLGLLPDSIMSIVNHTLNAGSLPKNYSVTVIDCVTKETLYGFANASADKGDIVTCAGRALPKGCYYVDIRFTPVNQLGQTTTYLIIGSALLAALLLAAAYFYWGKKKVIPLDEQASINTKFVQIGKTKFHYELHSLEFDNVKTVLTNKESKLLYIFSASLNEIIDRNILQKEGWENEGVIVTRSLDMFVSKLRKKLQPDVSVKIVNFPGKGYKLEVYTHSF